MRVSQLEVLQLEILVQGRPVLDALNQIDSITAGPLSRKARTCVPWNHQPRSRSVPSPCLVRLCRGLAGTPKLYRTHAIDSQDLITYTAQKHTCSLHSQRPLAQGATCACTCAAPARSKMVVARSVELEERNIVKGVWGSRALWVES